MEAKLQKLKVTELKELLAKHHLVQTGKKDDLIKRLLDNNVAVDGEPTEELTDPDITAPVPSIPESSSLPPAAPTTEQSSSSAPVPTENASTTIDELTPEQKAMKARAERFGMPFNPNPPSKTTPKSQSNGAAPASTSAPTPAPEKKQKAGAIDSTSLGISQDILDKRAAKFGLPEKKESQAQAQAPTSAATKPAATNTKPESKKVESKKEEISPEMAEKIAIEEEKKRKRAEKFGLSKPANGTEPDTKKVKV